MPLLTLIVQLLSSDILTDILAIKEERREGIIAATPEEPSLIPRLPLIYRRTSYF